MSTYEELQIILTTALLIVAILTYTPTEPATGSFFRMLWQHKK